MILIGSLAVLLWYTQLVGSVELAEVGGAFALGYAILLWRDIACAPRFAASSEVATPVGALSSGGQRLWSFIEELTTHTRCLEWESRSMVAMGGSVEHDEAFGEIVGPSVRYRSDLGERVLRYIQHRFRATHIVVGTQSGGAEMTVTVNGAVDDRLRSEILRGQRGGQRGVQGVGEERLELFGIRHALRAEFADRSTVVERQGYIWLGYSDSAPTAVEERWLAELVSRVERELTYARQLNEYLDAETLRSAPVEGGEFVTSLSHDMRAPIDNLRAIFSLLSRSRGGGEEELLRCAQRNCDALGDIVDEVVDRHRYRSGHLSSFHEQCDLRALVNDVVDSFAVTAGVKRIALRCVAPEKPVVVIADRLQLKRAIANIIGNAIKYTSAGGVTVSFEESSSSHPVLTVADTGVGLSAEAIARLFTPFARFTAGAPGTGLGLAFTKFLLEENNANLSVHSELGIGSRFTIRFLPPLSLAPESASQAFRSAPAAVSSLQRQH